CGILHGPLLDLRDSRGNTDHDAWVYEHLPAVCFLNEVRQHFLGDCKVGDDAIFHRPDSHDIAGSPAKHVLRFLTYGFRLIGELVDRNNGGFIDYDTATFGVDQSVGCTQVDRQIARKQTEERTQGHVSSWAPYSFQEIRYRSAPTSLGGIKTEMLCIISEIHNPKSKFLLG